MNKVFGRASYKPPAALHRGTVRAPRQSGPVNTIHRCVMHPLHLSHEHALEIAAYAITLSEIQRYPVKGMKGERLTQTAIETDVPLAHNR